MMINRNVGTWDHAITRCDGAGHFLSSFESCCSTYRAIFSPPNIACRDAYYMRKDFDKDIASEAPTQQQQQQPQRQWRRGEKEREEWLGRDAARGGSFFENRKSIRDTLSEEERARIATINSRNTPMSPSAATPSMSGQFKRNLRTFFNGREPSGGSREGQFQRPPWETGPEGLRLPRYVKVTRRAAPTSTAAASEVTGLRGLVANLPVVDVENFEEETEGALSGTV